MSLRFTYTISIDLVIQAYTNKQIPGITICSLYAFKRIFLYYHIYDILNLPWYTSINECIILNKCKNGLVLYQTQEFHPYDHMYHSSQSLPPGFGNWVDWRPLDFFELMMTLYVCVLSQPVSFIWIRSLFEVLGKFQSHSKKMAQCLHYVILLQIVTFQAYISNCTNMKKI